MNGLFNKKINICDEFLDKVSDFREGNLDEETQVRLEAHRIDCAKCRRSLIEEEKIAAMMASVPRIKAPANFRDNVLREWRLRRDSVKETVPLVVLKRLQIAMLAFVGAVLYLPVVRQTLLVSATRLSGALERLPVESRERIPITIEIPTVGELAATFQVWEGSLFRTLGEYGTAIAPLTGWLWAVIIVAVAAGVANYFLMNTRLNRMRSIENSKGKS